MVAWGDECTRRSVKTSSLSSELQAVAVSDACVRISLICASVKTRAFFKALSIALISSRCARSSLSSCLHSLAVTLSIVSRPLKTSPATSMQHLFPAQLERSSAQSDRSRSNWLRFSKNRPHQAKAFHDYKVIIIINRTNLLHLPNCYVILDSMISLAKTDALSALPSLSASILPVGRLPKLLVLPIIIQVAVPGPA